jgi:hypothetical protein
VYGKHLVATFSTLATVTADYLMEHDERLADSLGLPGKSSNAWSRMPHATFR